ncbi:MAG: hypothetical protein EAZ75_01785 [Flavobacteriia bacterium]|jgi:hypothetical protein|nr:MAG: hypothetical protein EAZ75_01785 [Flavobacteriia bacterium]
MICSIKFNDFSSVDIVSKIYAKIENVSGFKFKSFRFYVTLNKEKQVETKKPSNLKLKFYGNY